MSAHPEPTYTASVHKHLPPLSALYREKMANPYRGGTPDWWYSGKGVGSSDLWIEWKYIAIPARPTTEINLIGGKKPPISALQQNWLRERHAEGRNVWVIVGSKEGGVIFTEPSGWEQYLDATVFRRYIMDRATIAAQITNAVTGKMP